MSVSLDSVAGLPPLTFLAASPYTHYAYTFTPITAGSLTFSWADDSTDHAFIDAVTLVPEPTTMIAGAMLLLPFGASTLRVLRRNRVAVA